MEGVNPTFHQVHYHEIVSQCLPKDYIEVKFEITRKVTPEASGDSSPPSESCGAGRHV